MFINNFITQLTDDMDEYSDDFPVSPDALSILRTVDFPITISSSIDVGNQDFEITKYKKTQYSKTLERGLEGTSVKQVWPKGSYVYVSITAGTINKLARPAKDTTPKLSDFSTQGPDIYLPLHAGLSPLVTSGTESAYDDEQNYLGEEPVMLISHNGGASVRSIRTGKIDFEVKSISAGYMWASGRVAALLTSEDEGKAVILVYDVKTGELLGESVFTVGVDIAKIPVYATFKDFKGLYTEDEFYSLSSDYESSVFTIGSGAPLNFTFNKLEENLLIGSYYGLIGYNDDGDVFIVYQSSASSYREADQGTKYVARIQHLNGNEVSVRDDGLMNIGDSTLQSWASQYGEKITSACGFYYQEYEYQGYAIGTSDSEIALFDKNLNRIGGFTAGGVPIYSLRFTGEGFIWRTSEDGGKLVTSLVDGFQDGYMPAATLRDIYARLEVLEDAVAQITP